MENFNLDLLIKICNLKYKEKIQQKDIAQQLKLSTAKVSRMLQKAFELGLIQVYIIDLNNKITELESSLEKKYNLRRVMLVKKHNNSIDEMKKMIGQRIANYLLNTLNDKDCIGMSHSSTVMECINALPIKISKKVEVVQMHGGSENLTFKGLDSTKKLSDKFGITPHIIFAPFFTDSSEIKNTILRDSSIKRTFNYFNNINIALVGIGKFHPMGESTLFKSCKLSDKEKKELEEAKVVGDIFGHFFNYEGNFCKTSVEDRIITIPVNNISKITYRIGAAAGIEKFDAVYGAIKGRLINILVTDEETGYKLLGSGYKLTS